MKLRNVQKIAITLGCVLGAGIAFVGIAHTPQGKPLLALLGAVPGCPVSLDKVDPERVEAYRIQQMTQHAGEGRARSVPATDLELGASRSQVQSWLDRRGARCEDKRGASVIACSRVDGDAGPLMREVHLQFDARDRLVAMDLFRDTACAAEALRHLAESERHLESRVGPVTNRTGKADAVLLDERRYQRVSSRFSYANYTAELSAMNYGARGVRVRETYQWLPGVQAAASSEKPPG